MSEDDEYKLLSMMDTTDAIPTTNTIYLVLSIEYHSSTQYKE